MLRTGILIILPLVFSLQDATAGEGRVLPTLAWLSSEPRLAPDTTPDTSELRDKLLETLAATLPNSSPDFRGSTAQRYLDAKQHKAQAVATPDGLWRVNGAPSPELAEEKALESCQLRYGRPCAVVAINDIVKQSGAGGDWPRRDMARVSFEGVFSQERIPAVTAAVAKRPDVAGYGLAANPKAMAIHPWGRLFVVTAASSQRDAEQLALAACNNDPSRAGKDGPCYLYAVGNRVILPQRHKEPRPPATTIADALATMAIRGVADNYDKQSQPHKALAVHVDSGRTFRFGSAPTIADAEREVLEACQLRYGTPCTLIAVDNELRAPDPFGAPRQDMVRLKYSGAYRFDQVPTQANPEKNKQLIDYASMKSPKAMAIKSTGQINTATGNTVAEAEAKALAACNDPDPAYPCYLYASNDQVVIAQRRTEPSR